MPTQRLEATNGTGWGIIAGALGITGGYLYYKHVRYEQLKEELFNALHCKDYTSIKRVLDKGITADVTCSGHTALQYALLAGCTQDCIELLLSREAHVSYNDWTMTQNRQIAEILKDKYYERYYRKIGFGVLGAGAIFTLGLLYAQFR